LTGRGKILFLPRKKKIESLCLTVAANPGGGKKEKVGMRKN